MDVIKTLESERKATLQQIAGLGDLRPGSLSPFSRKCYKPSCHCAEPGGPGHSGWQLTRKDADQKTLTHYIPKREPEATRKQVEEYGRFRDLARRCITSIQMKSGRLISILDTHHGFQSARRARKRALFTCAPTLPL